MPASDPLTRLPTPHKSETDKKEYRVVKLDNGLTAMLISDLSYPLEKLDQEEEAVAAAAADGNEDMEEDDGDDDSDMSEDGDESSGSDMEDDDGGEEEEDESSLKKKKLVSTSSGLKKSAAGLCVGVGSFSDPEDLPGLAHFLEHMVFMGSDKYPDENSFDDFIQLHGGSDNASTDCETTVFYFDAQRKFFREALDRFAQFFVSPLMKRQTMQREREAVDSEFEMALPSDYNRRQQIFGALASDGHPMAKFMWGNTASLTDDGKMSDEAVNKRLHEFKDRHYSAGSMTLTVQSQEELDTLEQWVKESFSKVPNKGKARESFDHMTDPFKTDGFSHLYKLAPIRDTYQIDMNWAMPPMQGKYRNKPLHYLSWIIGHEGKGSLIAYLRKKVWALSLTAGNAGDGFEQNSTYSIFTITVVLTKAGYENVDKVFETVFSYLKMMEREGPQERIFNEIKAIEELNFRFGEERQPASNVETLCENMQFYPPELYLTADELLFEFDAKLIADCQSRLDAASVNVFMMAREFKEDCKVVEPWFKTCYAKEQIPAEWRRRWADPHRLDGELHLPAPNLFIAEDTTLKPVPEDNPKYPRLVAREAYGELFHRMDDIFKQPRAHILFYLVSPTVLRSVKDAVCLDVLVNCVSQLMVEETYAADLAQLSFSFYSTERGIIMKVSGLNDKLGLLLDKMADVFCSYETSITPATFRAVCEQTKKNYYNHFIKPMKLAREARITLLQEPFRQSCKKHAIILDTTLKDVSDFLADFKSQMFLQCLAQGNVTEGDALAYFERLRAKLAYSASPADAVTDMRCREMPVGSFSVTADTLNRRDGNTCLTNYYQMGPGDLKSLAVVEMANVLIEEPVFDKLRTQEQLGYQVFSTFRNTYGVLGLSISVCSQASKFSPEFLDERVEAFLKWFVEDKLVNMKPEEFQQMLDTMVKLKKAADVTLAEEVNRNWSEITVNEYLFNRHEIEIEMLENYVTKEKVADLLGKLLFKSDTVRKLSVRIVGNSNLHSDKDGEGDGEAVPVEDGKDDPSKVFDVVCKTGAPGAIADMEAFRSKLKLHPVIRIN